MPSARSPIPALHSSQAATPVSFIRAVLLAYQRYGINPNNALKQAGILHNKLSERDGRVTAAQMETMCDVAMRELDDEALGWFSRKLPWGSYGMLCRASLTAPNLEVALKRWCRHHRLLTEDIELKLTVSRAAAKLTVKVNYDLGEMLEFCLISCLRFVLGYTCWVIDSRLPLIEATFPFPAPKHQNIYPKLFPGPVRFEAEEASFSFVPMYLALSLRRDEAALQTMLQRALPLTVLPYKRDRLLVQRIRQLLCMEIAEAVTAENLAQRVHMSPRTLHRQLLKEGVSLQVLKDESRRERAIDLLTRTKRPIKQVALAAGFRNEKSFARAFRQWTGTSPGEFRNESRR